MTMNHTEAAKHVGINNTTVSKLMQWPRFKREYRRRRAAMVEHADARLQGMMDTLFNAAAMALRYHAPHVVEYQDRKGRTRYRTMEANPSLAVNTALQLMAQGRERVKLDELLSRANDIEAMVKKKLKKAE
jgi:hypothetical protein